MENKMAAGLSLFAFALAVVMAIVLNACPANGDITCKDALLCVLPCEPFLASSGPPTPSFSCCAGVAKVAAQATTPAIRKGLCECLKTAATGIQIDPPKLEQLPQFCKVSLPVTLDPHINCSQ
jgi:hypothetical protein